MKILLSAYACEPNKGSEPAVGWHWALELSKLGHEVWIITRTNNKPSIDAEFSKCTQPENLHFIYYDLPPWIRRFKKGKRFVHAYYLLWQWGAYQKAKAAHGELKFDLVHHVTFVSVRQPSFMGNLGIPFIFGPVAGGESAPWRLRLHYGIRGFVLDAIRDLANFCVRLDPFMWRTFRQAKKIYVTSEQTKNLVPCRFHHKTYIQLAIGIDPPSIVTPDRKAPSSPTQILYVGQFIYLKGMDLGLRAFAKFSAQAPDAHLTMVGKGPDEQRLRNLSEKLNISDRITWIPWIAREKLSVIYGQHDIFLFPSMHDSGGLVVLEAMSHGLPVICLDLGGPGLIVTENTGVKICASGKSTRQVIEQMAKAFFLLSKDSVLYRSMSKNAFQYSKHFSWAHVIDTIHL